MFQSGYDEKRKQWRGLENRPLYNPEISLGEVLLKTMQVNGSKIAQVNFKIVFNATFRNFYNYFKLIQIQ